MTDNDFLGPEKLEGIDIEEEKVSFFRYKEFNDGYLITNDFGYYRFLNTEEFRNFLEGEIEEGTELYEHLRREGFIKDISKLNVLKGRYCKRNACQYYGPDLHIIVLTMRCNQNCIYCQASSKGVDRKDLDMDKETAAEAVDLIFDSTSQKLTIEFQGGEPMVNWPVLKFIVKYAQEKAEQTGKEVSFSLVSNFTLMNEERLQFLIDNWVGISTSLDGPRELHNKNRPYSDGDSYEVTTKWIKKYKELEERGKRLGNTIFNLNALLTVSRFSLNHPREIIDEYVDLGLKGIHLRSLSYLGLSGGEAKKHIGYSAEEFLDYWRTSLDYIIKLNKEQDYFIERGARIMLKKILTDEDPGFTDLRSPCGAVMQQLVYDYDGFIYTCDEGRMVEGDTFKIGSVHEDTYEDIIKSDVTETMLTASTLENQPCDLCVYKPYCGVCPVKNFAHQGTLFPHMPSTNWCKIFKGQFDYLFKKIKEPDARDVFDVWLDPNKAI